MLVFICVSLIILYSLYLPVWASASVEADIMQKRGHLALRIFDVPVFKLSFAYESERAPSIKVKHRKKSREIHISNDETDKDSVVYIAKNSDMTLLSFVDIKSVGFEARVGSLNALLTTLALGSIRVLFYQAAAFLKSRQMVDIEEKFVPEYNSRTLKFGFSSILCISAGEVIAGLAVTLFNKIKRSLRRSYDY